MSLTILCKQPTASFRFCLKPIVLLKAAATSPAAAPYFHSHRGSVNSHQQPLYTTTNEGHKLAIFYWSHLTETVWLGLVTND